MYFDPISTWLVALISNGAQLGKEKISAGKISDYDQKRIKQINDSLNGNIRRVKEKYGVELPEMAYEKIQLHISIAQDDTVMKSVYGYINIDIDNQEYIISVLEACADWYSKYSHDDAQKKSEWYKKAAKQARIKKEKYCIEYKEARRREKEKEKKERDMSDIYLCLGIIAMVIFALVIF